MGLSQSSEEDGYKQVKSQFYDPAYMIPKHRRSVREKPAKEVRASPLIDPTANKFDYVIVFTKTTQDKVISVNDYTGLKDVKDPNEKHVGLDEGDEENPPDVNDNCFTPEVPSDRRVYWKDTSDVPLSEMGNTINAYDAWFDAIPGDKDAKLKGVKQLEEKWKESLGAHKLLGKDNIPYGRFLDLTRDLIVQTLMNKSGLQLKLTKRKTKDDDGNPIERVYCRIRGPISLLEKKADQLDHRLQFKPEVDPGTAFWTTKYRGENVEIEEEEEEVSTKAKANEELANLYKLGHITAHDAFVFEEDEHTPLHWTRRIRTLERIADRVPSANRYNAFATYDAKPRDRHLYQEYETVRGKSLLLPKDRLYLTRTILDTFFDFDVLSREEIIDCVFPLHDSNYGEALTVDSFFKTWIFPFFTSWDKIGAPYVSYPGCKSGERLSGFTAPFLIPFSQPLFEVREYFGEQVALYFAWLGFYGTCLVVPAALGILFQTYVTATDADYIGVGIKWYEVSFTVAMVLWASRYAKAWRNEERVCAVAWGTRGYEDQECDRPQFHGDVQEPWYWNWAFGCPRKPEEPRRISETTFELETYYPEYKREIKTVINLVMISFLIFFLTIVICANGFVENNLVEGGMTWAPYACDFVTAVQIKVVSMMYEGFVDRANDWENHQTDTQYEDAKILKTFMLQVVNNYGPVWFAAYGKRYLFGCANDNCITNAKQLLVFIFVVRFFLLIYETLAPIWSQYLKKLDVTKEAAVNTSKIAPVKMTVGICKGKQAGEVLLLYWNEKEDLYEDIENLEMGFLPPTNAESFFNDVQSVSQADPMLATVDCKVRVAGGSEISLTIEEILGKARGAKFVCTQAEGIEVVASNSREAKKEEMLGEIERYEFEYYLDEFEGMFADYAAIIIQMGYVVMFSLIWPFLPCFALLEVLMQIRGDAWQFCFVRRRADPAPQEDVGFWAVLMSIMPYAAILANVATICFTTNALDDWSAEKKVLTFLVMEHLILIVKMSGVFMPKNPAWLEAVIARQDFVVDKHKNMKEEEEIDMDAAGGGGNLDADDMNLSARAATLKPQQQSQVDYLKEQLRKVEYDINELRKQLKKAGAGEIWNEDTGVSESTMHPGLALGMVNVTILSISGLGTDLHKLREESTRVVVQVRDNTQYGDEGKPYEGNPGPAPVVSRRGKEKSKNGKVMLEINQEIQLPGVKTSKAEIVLDIIDEKDKKKRGSASIELKDISDQVVHDKYLKITPKPPSDKNAAGGVIYVKALFQFSKVKPIKERLYRKFEMKRHIEKDITNITIGREPQHITDFP